MVTASYSEFRSNMKAYLDRVEEDQETLFLNNKGGKVAVIISVQEYNAIMETLHLLRSPSNAKRLYESIGQIKKGQVSEKN